MFNVRWLQSEAFFHRNSTTRQVDANLMINLHEALCGGCQTNFILSLTRFGSKLLESCYFVPRLHQKLLQLSVFSWSRRFLRIDIRKFKGQICGQESGAGRGPGTKLPTKMECFIRLMAALWLSSVFLLFSCTHAASKPNIGNLILLLYASLWGGGAGLP